MGTYTTNYNLFMPSIGEQGWGDLVNGNFSTLDSTIKGLDTRTTALESADTAFNTRITAIEKEVNGALNCTSVTTTSITTNTLTVNGANIKIPTTLSYGTVISVTIATSGGSASAQSTSGTLTIVSSPFPLTGVIRAAHSSESGKLYVIENGVLRTITLSTTETNYTVTKCTLAWIWVSSSGSSYWASSACKFGTPIYS